MLDCPNSMMLLDAGDLNAVVILFVSRCRLFHDERKHSQFCDLTMLPSPDAVCSVVAHAIVGAT
jgi:hypothetical protein